MGLTTYIVLAIIHLAFFSWAELLTPREERSWPMVFQLSFGWPMTWLLFVVVGVARWPSK